MFAISISLLVYRPTTEKVTNTRIENATSPTPTPIYVPEIIGVYEVMELCPTLELKCVVKQIQRGLSRANIFGLFEETRVGSMKATNGYFLTKGSPHSYLVDAHKVLMDMGFYIKQINNCTNSDNCGYVYLSDELKIRCDLKTFATSEDSGVSVECKKMN